MAAGLFLLVAKEPLLAVVGTAIVAMLVALRGDVKHSLTGASSMLLGVVYTFGAWRCALELRGINPHWLMVAVLVNWAGDTTAMYVGKAIGKHKLAPEVSPGKTWEGALGSAVAGTLAAAVYGHYLIPGASLMIVTLTGAAANIAGQFGDLCESAFKRGAGLKDSGNMLPGHGGWLDRIDSTLFSVPATYGVLRLLLPYL
jgi:phosphatidate cytidylyltransferase